MKYAERESIVAQLREKARGLNELADFFENHPAAIELPKPYITTPELSRSVREYERDTNGNRVLDDNGNYKLDEFETRLMFRKFAKAMTTGSDLVHKTQDDYYYGLAKKFSGGVQLRYYTDRSAICERIVTGKRHVEEYVVPAHDEDIVEWKCTDSLLAVKEV